MDPKDGINLDNISDEFQCHTHEAFMTELPCLEETWKQPGSNQWVGYQLHNSAIKSVLIGKIKTKDYCKDLE